MLTCTLISIFIYLHTNTLRNLHKNSILVSNTAQLLAMVPELQPMSCCSSCLPSFLFTAKNGLWHYVHVAGNADFSLLESILKCKVFLTLQVRITMTYPFICLFVVVFFLFHCRIFVSFPAELSLVAGNSLMVEKTQA